MINKSIWSDFKDELKCKRLSENLNVDVLIIGAGITGLSTAYHLINSGLNVCIVERNRVGLGVSSKTTGKISYLQEDVYSKLEKQQGFEVAKDYLDSQKEAINIISEIIAKNKIQCDFKKTKSYIIIII